jgi:hypothetical protein
MRRKILCCVLRQPPIDNISIDLVAHIHDIVIFTGYSFSLSSTGFFPTRSQYFSSSDIVPIDHRFSFLFYIVFPSSSNPTLIYIFMYPDIYISGLPIVQVSTGVQKVSNGVHVGYNFFPNGVHLWGTNFFKVKYMGNRNFALRTLAVGF